MIEIEKKFVIINNNKNQLISRATFLYKENFIDIYYDTSDFSLTLKDMWLRSRNNNFELKIPVAISDKDFINQYKEITNESLISKHLNLQENNSIEKNLANNKYNPFCKLTTTREKYRKGIYSIDIDTVVAEDFYYSIIEIELMVEKESDMKSAINKLASFIAENNISESPVRGKVIEYIRQKSPGHYNALLFAGVIKQK